MFDNEIPNPFDPASLRLSEDFLEDVATEIVMTTLEVRKPKRNEFIRVNPDKSYQLEIGIIEVEEDRCTYLVPKEMHNDLATDLTPVLLVVAVNRAGTSFLWPLKLPRPGGRASPWHTSARAAAMEAETSWVRVVPEMSKGHYALHRATGNLGDPVFPAKPFSELLRLAFSDRVINSPKHDVVRRLRGEL